MATSVSKLLISLTKFSNKTSKVIDATDAFNATGSFYQDVSGWDSAVAQIVSPSETISFKTTNDDNAVLGDLLPAPEVPTNWLAVEGINLADKSDVSSVNASANVAFGIIGKYLQFAGATVSAAPSFAYLLSRESNSVVNDVLSTGVSIGNKVVYASTATPTSVTAFYGDSALTQPVFGDGNYYALRLMTGSTIYAATISSVGVVTIYVAPTTTTAASTTTTAAPTTTTAAPTTTTTAAPSNPTLYVDFEPDFACLGAGFYNLPTYLYTGTPTLCGCTSLNADNATSIPAGTYYVSDTVNTRQFTSAGGGSTLLTAAGSCVVC